MKARDIGGKILSACQRPNMRQGHGSARLTYVIAAAVENTDDLPMPGKRQPETERDRAERIKLIGDQIAAAIKRDAKELLAEQEQRRGWWDRETR